MWRGLLLLSVLVTAGLTSPAAPVAFDKPESTDSVSGSNRYRQPMLWTCSYYRHFTIKAEHYAGSGIRDADFYLVPALGSQPVCSGRMRGQHRLSWYGRLVGVRGNYILLDDPGERNQPTRFGIYDAATGHGLLEDSRAGDDFSLQFSADGFVVAYRRVFNSNCPLWHGLSTQCWTDIKRATGLTDAMAPDCRAPYEAARRKITFADDLKFLARRPVKITYNVEARYGGGKLAISARQGPVECALAYEAG